MRARMEVRGHSVELALNHCLPWLSNPTPTAQLPASMVVAYPLFAWLHPLLPLPLLLFPSVPPLPAWETQFSFTFQARPHGCTPLLCLYLYYRTQPSSGSSSLICLFLCRVDQSPQQPRAELCLAFLTRCLAPVRCLINI